MMRSSSENWAEQLIAWFGRSSRTLPWRDAPTPYRVLVSEFMCQQTQIATVLPFFGRFMEQFPTLEALASASQDQVLKAWEGLGYYTRARNLLRCAQAVVAAGQFPRQPEALMELPGIGSYTSAAIASIAFGLPYPVVDGNVLRVRTRMTADATPVAGDKAKKRYYQSLVPVIEQVSNPSHFNQAMMELGALVCHPQNPLCETCPVRQECRAYAEGNPLKYPCKESKPTPPHYHVAVGLIYSGEQFLILKRDESQMLGGLWEFPGGKLEPGESAEQAVIREIQEETGLEVAVERSLAVVRHTYSHFSITMQAFRCRLLSKGQLVQTERPHRWICFRDIAKYTFPKANHKIFEAMEQTHDK